MRKFIVDGLEMTKNHVYYYKGEHKIPVTSVCDIFPKPWLAAWAAKEAALKFARQIEEGKTYTSNELDKIVDISKNAYNVKRDMAADTGSMFHDWLGNYIKTGERGDVKDTDLVSLVTKFLAWESENKVEWLASEIMILGEKGYAGTLDILARINKVIWLLDAKTNDEIRITYRMQTGAYTMGFNYCFKTPVIQKRGILSVPKEEGVGVSLREINTPLKDDYAIFLSMLDFKKKLMSYEKKYKDELDWRGK